MNETEQKEVFDSWLSTHKGLLFKVVRAYAFTTHDTEDLFQEIVLAVWNSVPSFRQESALTTWLYRVALYTAIAWSKKEKRHASKTKTVVADESLLFELKPKSDARLDWLYDQIARLDEVDRSLMLLMLDGFSYRQMAETLGISESHVGVKLNRLRRQLKKMGRQSGPVEHQ